MSHRSRVAVLATASLLVPGLLAPAAATPATRPTVGEVVQRLASDDHSARFEAAYLLVREQTPEIDDRLAQALVTPEFLRSKTARAAAEFVRLKRAGKGVPRARPGATDRPSVFLISIDTLRADHLGCYGYERATSPAIDSLAEQGALFENALSPSSWTLPAHMSIFTSLYPSFHKLEKGGRRGAPGSTSRSGP